MSSLFLSRKMAMPESVLNADNTEHVVSITVVKSTNNYSNYDKVNSESDWKPSVPHRPQPVHMVRPTVHIKNEPDRHGVNGDQTKGLGRSIDASVDPVYGASNRSAFTKPGFSAYNRSGKFINFILNIL